MSCIAVSKCYYQPRRPSTHNKGYTATAIHILKVICRFASMTAGIESTIKNAFNIQSVSRYPNKFSPVAIDDD